ncbi:flagellar hook-basal body complex protein FliE [uncultured Microbulbifer sp.]|uniref:flagellar hook-basal body complex protein FliE n=1 Tax=uncultured Microbulbifer sp. TaxID=348147 RepID=UPI002624B077|nr:flagellar hook-basal body complex protein FliE [uncultured Microbulbifer sp.]
MTIPITAPEMQGMLNQMRGLASEAAAPRALPDLSAPGGAPAVGGGFGEALKESLQRINALQIESGARSRAFQSGESDVALHEVMIAGQKAGIAFELGVQVRNRLLTAYKDIMNMQV